MSFANDLFTDTSGIDIASHTPTSGGTWTRNTSVTTDLLVISSANRVRHDVLNTQITQYYHSASPATAEYDVEMDIIVVGAIPTQQAGLGVVGRIDTAADTGYRGLHFIDGSGGDAWYLQYTLAGSLTTLGSFAQVLTLNQAYHLLLQIRDAAKKLFVDGVERISSADNTITAAGKSGLYGYSSGIVTDSLGPHGDNWVASDPAAGGLPARIAPFAGGFATLNGGF